MSSTTGNGSARELEPAGGHDRFYRFVVAVGRAIFRVSSRPVVLHAQRVPVSGGALLASNHTSHYDVACLMNSCPRPIDFVSIVEVERRPLVAAFFRRLNCVFLDRARSDAVTAKAILARLRAGRLVGIFPEGRLTPAEASVLRGGEIVSGIGQLAQLTNAPVVPCVVLDTANFAGFAPWLPLRRTRYAVAFGEPIVVRGDLPRREARLDLEDRWRRSLLELETELSPRMSWRRAPGSSGVVEGARPRHRGSP